MIVSQIPNKKIKDRREKLTENVKLYQAAERDVSAIASSERNQANGVAGLNESGKLIHSIIA